MLLEIGISTFLWCILGLMTIGAISTIVIIWHYNFGSSTKSVYYTYTKPSQCPLAEHPYDECTRMTGHSGPCSWERDGS